MYGCFECKKNKLKGWIIILAKLRGLSARISDLIGFMICFSTGKCVS
jgi:hypothetical protein